MPKLQDNTNCQMWEETHENQVVTDKLTDMKYISSMEFTFLSYGSPEEAEREWRPLLPEPNTTAPEACCSI